MNPSPTPLSASRAPSLFELEQGIQFAMTLSNALGSTSPFTVSVREWSLEPVARSFELLGFKVRRDRAQLVLTVSR